MAGPGPCEPRAVVWLASCRNLWSVDTARIERVLDAAYLADLESRPMDELRSMRAECQELEVGLSYLRRLVQGRLDIVNAEVGRRRSGGEAVDTAALVQQLPEILADRGRSPGVGRLPQLLAPDLADTEPDTAELDAIVDAGVLTRLGDRSDDELEALCERLGDYERSVSERRRALHERIDTVQAEMTRRYRTGEASVESLLR